MEIKKLNLKYEKIDLIFLILVAIIISTSFISLLLSTVLLFGFSLFQIYMLGRAQFRKVEGLLIYPVDKKYQDWRREK